VIVSAMICDGYKASGERCTEQGPAYERKAGRATKGQVKTIMRARGWSCGRKDLCPSCAKKKGKRANA